MFLLLHRMKWLLPLVWSAFSVSFGLDSTLATGLVTSVAGVFHNAIGSVLANAHSKLPKSSYSLAATKVAVHVESRCLSTLPTRKGLSHPTPPSSLMVLIHHHLHRPRYLFAAFASCHTDLDISSPQHVLPRILPHHPLLHPRASSGGCARYPQFVRLESGRVQQTPTILKASISLVGGHPKEESKFCPFYAMVNLTLVATCHGIVLIADVYGDLWLSDNAR